MNKILHILLAANIFFLAPGFGAEPDKKPANEQNTLGSLGDKGHMGKFASMLAENKKIRPMVRDNRHAQDEVCPRYTDVMQQQEHMKDMCASQMSQHGDDKGKARSHESTHAVPSSTSPRTQETPHGKTAETAEVPHSKRENRKDFFANSSTRILQFFGKIE